MDVHGNGLHRGPDNPVMTTERQSMSFSTRRPEANWYNAPVRAIALYSHQLINPAMMTPPTISLTMWMAT